MDNTILLKTSEVWRASFRNALVQGFTTTTARLFPLAAGATDLREAQQKVQFSWWDRAFDLGGGKGRVERLARWSGSWKCRTAASRKRIP